MNTLSPPPLKRPPFKTDNFAHQLAKASWVCPIIIAILLVMGRSGSGVIIDLVTLLLILLGLVFGIIALFGIRKHGKKGILAPAVAGIIINAFLLFIFASNFLAAVERVRQQRFAVSSPVVVRSKAKERRVLRNNNPPADNIQSLADNDTSPALSGPVEITSEMGDSFCDLVFYIEKHRRLPDGSQIIRCSGKHQGIQVGFEVQLGVNWQEGSFGEDIPIVSYAGEVTYHSVGDNSDAFLHTLDKLFGTKLNPVGMTPDIAFKGFSLEGDPRNLGKGQVKIKLFFVSENEDEYAELFTNIDLPKHRLEVREKDMDYRKPLVKALSKQKGNQ